ncbi:Lar family restriction alleviation protein [Geitlerinema calcuttense]|uniref:Uncharacterized protein n=1 Tax=Geitlerinema calcuttense NRMC-F 0142 TaxID=2922238 RepID=A0ABT7LYJ8_9CYAN|nr:Lar family restriction alleviation protein [Geitlerinema calcuttense]MDL5055876.1 hypothetical protein [Geitlerinema calcuttense NRMC-F 0142]
MSRGSCTNPKRNFQIRKQELDVIAKPTEKDRADFEAMRAKINDAYGLRPCPFCGSSASFTEDKSPSRDKIVWLVGCDNEDCPAMPLLCGNARKIDAAKAWNSRVKLGPMTLSDTTSLYFCNGFKMPLKVNDDGDCVVDQDGNIVADFTLNGDPNWTDFDLGMILNHIADAINAYTVEEQTDAK